MPLVGLRPIILGIPIIIIPGTLIIITITGDPGTGTTHFIGDGLTRPGITRPGIIPTMVDLTGTLGVIITTTVGTTIIPTTMDGIIDPQGITAMV